MKTTQRLHDLGQSLWLDNITRELLIDGTLARYITELSVTGLTSNPSIFDHAIKNGSAELLRKAYDATGQVDGRVSLEVSPLLANDTAGTVEQAAQLHARAQCPNLFIKIPGTREGVPAIEQSIFAGVPINVTLLFSAEHTSHRPKRTCSGSSGASLPAAT